MINKFDDVKVGDSVFIRKPVSIRYGFGSNGFQKSFWIKLYVSSVTKTQFTAGMLRFKKSGAGIGDNSHYAYKSGDKEYHHSGELVPDVCQLPELSAYEDTLIVIKRTLNIAPWLINAESADLANQAAELVMKAYEIAKVKSK